jgi:predicted nucleic acid-binding protein
LYLVDTNVWLERILDQAKSEEVGEFLNRTPTERLFISDFAFHSIGVILTKLNRGDAFLTFVNDVFRDGNVTIVTLEPEEMPEVVRASEQFQLDFDDAYHYAVARKYELAIVSFDRDFDRTQIGRKIPAES